MIGSLFQTGVTPIGVDIGASGARMIQLRRARDGYAVVAAARVDCFTDAPDSPEHLASLAARIAERADSAGFIGRRCAVAPDDRFLRVKSLRMASLSDDETDQAVRVDAAERLGLPPETEAEIGWIRAGEVQQGEETRDEIILVGGERAVLERMTDALGAAGMMPIAVEPGFVACARALGRFYRRRPDQKHIRAVVDVGARVTGVIVLRGDKVSFYKQLEWGGEALDHAVAERLGLAADVARDLRRRRRDANAALDPRIDAAIFDAIRPGLDHLANEVTLCVRYAMVTFRGDRPEVALVVGGEAEEPRLAEALTHVMGVPAFAAHPLEGMDLAGAVFSGADRRGSMSQWATAMGLALRSAWARAPRRQRADKPAVNRRAAA